MRIGLAFDAKPPGAELAPGDPDDLFEEYDPEETIASIQGAIEACGHDVLRLGGGREFLEKILSAPVDFVFNISEGKGTFRSREGQVPSVLEMLGIPYSFSDPLTLGISLDKALTKRMVADAGVAVPPGWMLRAPRDLEELLASAPRFPLFAKPAYEGSSKGVRNSSLVRTPEELRAEVERTLGGYRQPVLVEGFVAGDEYTVAVLGNDPPAAVAAMRIRPQKGPAPDFVYSVEVKRDWRNQAAYDVPPPLSGEALGRLYDSAVRAFTAIGCRDVSRVDFRIRDGVPVFLEINPLPGLSPVYGDICLATRGMGIPYEELVRRILDAAFRRCGLA